MRYRHPISTGSMLAVITILLIISLGGQLPLLPIDWQVRSALAMQGAFNDAPVLPPQIADSDPANNPNTLQVVDPVIVAAGDIACNPRLNSFNAALGNETTCHMMATSNLVLSLQPTAVLTLGDNQYRDGKFDEFMQSFNPTWGRFKGIIRPAPGNHDYHTPGASGYYAYFGAAAGAPGQGYYSYNLGNWHLIALNAVCGKVGGCGMGSPQLTWLQNDLAAYRNSCVLAYWHAPRFSSGRQGSYRQYTPMWQALYDARAEIVLNGHIHNYERFGLQNPSGQADPNGIREFVVGTGGGSLESFGRIQPNSEVRNSDAYGVLKLTLGLTGYTWQFVPEAGKTFTDSGTGLCH